MKKIIWLTSILLVSTLACQKDEYKKLKEDFHEFQDNIDLSCAGGVSAEWHMNAKINGEDVCYNHQENGYLFIGSASNGYITQGPTLNTNDTSSFEPNGSWMTFKMSIFPIEDLTAAFYISSPKTDFGTSLYEQAERYLKEGDAWDTTEKEKFSFNLEMYCCPSFEKPLSFVVSSDWGTQPDDGYFRISKVSRRATPNYFYYDVTFEFQGDLYHKKGNGFKGGEYFGPLKDGVFVAQIAVLREG